MKIEKENVGSATSQIIVFTTRIKHLTEHLKQKRKDLSATKALLHLVSKRRRMLKYMNKKDPKSCEALRKKLSLRKI